MAVAAPESVPGKLTYEQILPLRVDLFLKGFVVQDVQMAQKQTDVAI